MWPTELGTIDGVDFDPTGTPVFFDGVPAANVMIVSSTQITCNSPPGTGAGFVDIEVAPGPGQSCGCGGCFEYF